MKQKSRDRHRETNELYELHHKVPLEIEAAIHRLDSFALRLSYIWELIQDEKIVKEQFGTILEFARKPKRSNEDPESVMG